MKRLTLCTVTLAALTSTGCGALGFQQAMRADYRPAVRHIVDPQRVIVQQVNGRPTLVDQNGPVQRPWRVVGVYTSTPWVPTVEGARMLGCDAFYENTVVRTHQSMFGTAIVTSYGEGSIDGIGYGEDDQLCLQYIDRASQERRRAETGGYIWTAYQRPPLGAGWALNTAFSWNPTVVGASSVLAIVSLEKYFRVLPLGFAIRIGGGSTPSNETLLTPGFALHIPVVSFWRAQLTAVGAIDYPIAFQNRQMVHGPRFGVGGYFDLVLGRICCVIGAGFEYWIAPTNPELFRAGPAIVGRFGFPF